MRTHYTAMAVMMGAALAGAMATQRADEPVYTTDFRLEECPRFAPNSRNLHFPLVPGRFWRYEATEDGDFVELEITVLDETLPITFEIDGELLTATTRVVEERETINGELFEVARNYFARCWNSQNVYYFGEDVDFYENGKIVGHAGSWLAGEDGAIPGLIMPELFLLGARYFQEIAPDIAEDRAEHMEMGLQIETPAGVFEDCVLVLETTPLEPGAENIKIYAPGVGLIVSDAFELVEYR